MNPRSALTRLPTRRALALSLALHLLVFALWSPQAPKRGVAPVATIVARLLPPLTPGAPPTVEAKVPRPTRRSGVPPQHLLASDLPAAIISAPLVAEPEAATGVDLDAVRGQARALALGSRREAPHPALQRTPEEPAPSPLAQGIARAQQANCRDKYAGLGLLGIPLLLRDQVTQKGCIW